MKLIVFIAFLFSLSSFAQDTGVIVTPQYPLDCRTQDYTYVNWVKDIRKVSEDESQAIFTFISQYGYCQNQRLGLYRLMPEQLSIQLFKKGFCLLCNEVPATATYRVLSETELQVTMVVNKKIAFKKNQERRLIFNFIPFYQEYWLIQNGFSTLQRAPFIFPWNVDLFFDDGTELTIH
jgi:hypothetical protein